jgi:hypothetical protein
MADLRKERHTNSHATAVLLVPILTVTLAFDGEAHLSPYTLHNERN